MMRVLVTLGIVLLTMQTALAQSYFRECPGIESGANAEQQVLCWFEREQRGTAGECAADKEGVSECTLQAVSWCAAVAFDDAPVADACFLSHLRAGQLDEALLTARYLQTSTGQIAKCRQALQSIKVKFVSVPSGAEMVVDGQVYGKMPVEVELQGQWWRFAALARFDAGESVTETEVTGQDLIAAFDRRACVMTEVVVKGGEAAPPPPPLVPTVRMVADEPSAQAPADEQTSSALPAVLSVAAGGAGLITGGILLAITASRKSGLESATEGTQWDKAHEDEHDSVQPLSIGGFIALGAGAALATVGVLLLTTAGGSSPESTAETASQTLRLTGRGIQWTGGF